MKYIDSQIVIDRVMNDLDMLFNENSSVIDDTILYPVIKKCMSKLKLNHHPRKWCLIRVDKGVGELPKDYYKACLLVLCHSDEVCSHGRFSECIHTSEEKICSLGKCDSTCNYDQQCGDYYRVIEKRHGGYLSRVNRYALLCPSKSSYDYCEKDCFNFKSQSKDEVIIDGDVIKLNVDSGLVYIDYLASLDDKIPDNEIIIDWVEKELIYKIFSVLYFTGIGDYVRRYQTSKFDADVSSRNARNLIKTAEVNEYYSLAREMQRRYSTLGNWFKDISPIKGTTRYRQQRF